MSMLALYGGDVAILLTSIAAAILSIKEAQGRVIARWRLLALGVLAIVSVLLLLAFPDPGDLLDKARWMLVLVAVLTGGARSQLMRLSADRAYGLVRVHRSPEVRWVAFAQAFFASIQVALEIATGDSRVEPTIEPQGICSAAAVGPGCAQDVWYTKTCATELTLAPLALTLRHRHSTRVVVIVEIHHPD
jgi:hypothetical protein